MTLQQFEHLVMLIDARAQYVLDQNKYGTDISRMKRLTTVVEEFTGIVEKSLVTLPEFDDDIGVEYKPDEHL